MATEKSLIDQIKALPEIEFATLIEEISDHVRRQKWEHIVDGAFRCENEDELLKEIGDLKEELASADNDNDFHQREVRELNTQLKFLKDKIESARAELSNT